MRKCGKFLLLVAAAALAAMAIGAASASAATVNNPGSHGVMTANLTFTGGIGQIHCNVSMAFYVSSNTDMIVTGWTFTNCTPNGTVYTPSNVPVSDANGNPPASPWQDPVTGTWADWTGNLASGGPIDWSGVLHGFQYQMVSLGLFCSFKGDLPLVYHNGATDADGTFTTTGTLPRVSGNAFSCGNTVVLNTTDTAVSPNTQNPFAFSAGDAGFTIS